MHIGKGIIYNCHVTWVHLKCPLNVLNSVLSRKPSGDATLSTHTFSVRPRARTTSVTCAAGLPTSMLCRFVVRFEDDTLVLVEDGNIVWSRDEALANVSGILLSHQSSSCKEREKHMQQNFASSRSLTVLANKVCLLVVLRAPLCRVSRGWNPLCAR